MLELGYDGAMMAPANTLRLRYLDAKADFANLGNRSEVTCWLTKLPLSPLTLVHDHPELAATAFYKESPVSCPLSEEQIAAVTARIKMRGGNTPPSWNGDGQLVTMDPQMQAMRQVQPVMMSLLKEMHALKQEWTRQSGDSDVYQEEQVEGGMITIINRGKGAPTEQTGKGEWTGPPGKGALPAFPGSGKGVALADVDAAGATAHPAEPLTPVPPVRQEAGEAVTSAIVVEKDTPPKALQPGVVTAARASVLATLAQVQLDRNP